MKLAQVKHIPKSVQKALDFIWGNSKPKNYDNICYTYGDTCYINSTTIPKDLERHEVTHTVQQGDNPDAWWERYAVDPVFRYEQELEAYRNQYHYVIAWKGRITAFTYAKFFAQSLSSPMYGNICTYNKALGDIIKV